MIGRLAVAATSAAIALAGLTGCAGGGASTEPTPAYDATVRTATCAEWNAESPAERHTLVTGMQAFVGGRVDQPGQRGQVLTERAAARLFDDYCARPFASEFALYRIYGNAAGFAAARTR